MGYFIAIITLDLTLDLNTRHTLILAVYFRVQTIFQKSATGKHQKRAFLKLPPSLKPVFVYMHEILISILMLPISELQLIFP